MLVTPNGWNNGALEMAHVRDSLRGQQFKTFVRVNISGHSYVVPTGVKDKTSAGLLGTFVSATHEHRLTMCNGYLDESKEYFFAR
jgi:hypothetical protein